VIERSVQIQGLLEAGAKRLLARATESHSLDPDALVPRIRSSVEKYLLKDDQGAADQSIVKFIDELQADDLCLIVACERGDETAWGDLVARFTTTVRSAARSASSNEDGAQDLAQSIWAELYGLRARADGKPAGKLAYYSGRGSLAGWLRAVVSQLAIDQHRKQSRTVQTEDDADFDRQGQGTDDGRESFLATGSLNPEEAMSDKSAGAEVQRALERSMKELPAEDRLLVKLYYFDGLRLKEAGRVLGVHEATASRRLTRIHGELRERVASILSSLGWTKRETEGAFAQVALHMEADLEPLLAAPGVVSDAKVKAGK
jgi:RNA polymerase sigma-70 factor, ECF subfamily